MYDLTDLYRNWRAAIAANRKALADALGVELVNAVARP